jgi:hypothetical protein
MFGFCAVCIPPTTSNTVVQVLMDGTSKGVIIPQSLELCRTAEYALKCKNTAAICLDRFAGSGSIHFVPEYVRIDKINGAPLVCKPITEYTLVDSN